MKPCTLFLLLPVFFYSCKNYSKVAIDATPQIPVDTTLLGIWTVAEDTDKRSFILIQDFRDVYPGAARPEQYSKTSRFDYYISYYNQHGRNPLFVEWRAYLSTVQCDSFLNIRCVNGPQSGGKKVIPGNGNEGYLFAKVMLKNNISMEVATIADTTLAGMKSPAQLREYFTKNVGRRGFYGTTLHLRRVSFFHGKITSALLKR